MKAKSPPVLLHNKTFTKHSAYEYLKVRRVDSFLFYPSNQGNKVSMVGYWSEITEYKKQRN